MCDCISKVEQNLLTRLQDDKTFKKPVKAVKLKGVIFPITKDGLSRRSSSEVEIELEGQKRKNKVSLAHSFCPFCGKAYEVKG